MTGQPIGINLAQIVHRLMTSPRGWRVSHLQEELGIAPRTYRKYRQILQQFPPFLRRDGTSTVVEVVDGDARYLRLRPPREFGLSSSELELYAAAVYLASELLRSMGNDDFESAARMLVADFHSGIRDRDFLLNGLLSHADRMFEIECAPVEIPHTRQLTHALVNRRMIEVTVAAGTVTVAPLTLRLRAAQATLIAMMADDIIELDVTAVERIVVLDDTFEYPTKARYPETDPTT